MREVIETDLDDATASASASSPVSLKPVCPFCGTVNFKDEPACPRCAMEDTAGTRQATRARLGPWYVLQHRNPSAPGMSLETLRALIEKGRVTVRSIVRGPTTSQLWKYAGKVKGISRDLGLCWGCGSEISKSAKVCPACKRLQEPPADADALLERKETEARPTPVASLNPAATLGGLASATRPPAYVERGAPQAELETFSMEGGFNTPAKPARRRPIIKAFALAAMLAIVAAGAYYYLNPVLWQQHSQWVAARWHDLTAPAAPQPDPMGDLPDRPTASPTTLPTTRPDTLTSATTRPAMLANRPATVDIGPSDAAQNPVLTPAELPRATAPSEVQIAPSGPAAFTTATERAYQLRVDAYQATLQHDYAKAVRCWEEMSRLPREAQHNDMDQCLKEARRLLEMQAQR